MTGNSYYYRKLHSLLGVVPVGFFLVEHMLTNYEAFRGGPVQFAEQVKWLNDLPLIFLLELFGIWLPLLYHGVYGLYVAFQSNNNVNRYSYGRNWMFTLQRVTGVITLVYIAWHVFQTRVQVALGLEHIELGKVMHGISTNGVMFALYTIGILAACFHFSNGMWSFLVSWGITIGPRAQKVSSYIWAGVFVVMAAMFIASLAAFMDPQFNSIPTIKD
ncbi:succinate dehydrogenase cytochrome b558 subunit [Paenibacillus sp. y28]|uniref:succinate dehydrogenase cytochrome b558 subunit n=1 Tax=Paenibacillus sp. y28 TaxID=3129110 RepID=UPI0030199B99